MRQFFQNEPSPSMNRVETSNLQESGLQLVVELEATTYDVNRCLMSKIVNPASAQRSCSDSAPSKILETTLGSLNLRNENSRRLLQYLLFDEKYIPIAKARGLIAAGSAILINAHGFYEFVPSELYSLLECCQLRDDQFVLSACLFAPAPTPNQLELTLAERACDGAMWSDLEVKALSATIGSLESEIRVMADNEKTHQTKCLSQFQQKNSPGKTVIESSP
jgi:hypothetical protein